MANNKPNRVDQSPSEQDILNRSFDPVGETLVVQLMGSPDGTNYYAAKVGADGNFLTGGGLVPSSYDYISIPSYNGDGNPLTVIYKTGGSGGTTVATLTLTYAGTNISSVTRT